MTVVRSSNGIRDKDRKCIALRVTPETYEVIKKNADRYDISVHMYLKRLIRLGLIMDGHTSEEVAGLDL